MAYSKGMRIGAFEYKLTDTLTEGDEYPLPKLMSWLKP